MGTNILVGPNSTGQGLMVLNNEGGETLERVAQRVGRCLIPGNIEGQVGCVFEQPSLVKDVPADGKGVGLGELSRPLSIQIFL